MQVSERNQSRIMAENIAGISSSAKAIQQYNNSMDKTTAVMIENKSSFRTANMSVKSMINSMNELNMIDEGTYQAISNATASMNIITGIISAYQGLKALEELLLEVNIEMAIAELTTMAVAQQWHEIALAFSALTIAGSIGAGAGYYSSQHSKKIVLDYNDASWTRRLKEGITET